jgi:translation initiation factor 2B subunit (eIF-2B alpha/beta/delta family)
VTAPLVAAEAALAEMARRRPKGSTGLALALLDASAKLSRDLGDLECLEAIQVLCVASVRWRPNRGALAFAATALAQLIATRPGGVTPAGLAAFSTAVRDFLRVRQADSARAVAAVLAERRSVLTVCSSTTVIEGLCIAANGGRLERAIVLETRPDFDGLATAAQLAQSGLAVTVVVDGAVAAIVDRVEAVAVGADVVSADGWLLNRIGTATVAEVAWAKGVPLYSAAPSYVLVEQPHNNLVVQTRDSGPMVSAYRLSDEPAFAMENLPEDLTPPGRVTAYLSSAQTFRPDEYVVAARSDLKGGIEDLVKATSP